MNEIAVSEISENLYQTSLWFEVRTKQGLIVWIFEIIFDCQNLKNHSFPRHNEDGSYSYGYEAADGSFKLETRFPDGRVKGKYGYVDIHTGKLKVNTKWVKAMKKIPFYALLSAVCLKQFLRLFFCFVFEGISFLA